MKAKIIIVITSVILAMAIILTTRQIISVNRQWPQLTVLTHSVGSTATVQDLNVTITDSYWLDGTSAESLLGDYMALNSFAPDQVKIVVAVMEVANTTDQPQRFNWPLCVFTAGLWRNGIDPDLARAFEPELPVDLTLEAHSSRTVTLATPVFAWDYASDEWNEAPGDDFGVTYLRYPSMLTLELGPLRQESR